MFDQVSTRRGRACMIAVGCARRASSLFTHTVELPAVLSPDEVTRMIEAAPSRVAGDMGSGGLFAIALFYYVEHAN